MDFLNESSCFKEEGSIGKSSKTQDADALAILQTLLPGTVEIKVAREARHGMVDSFSGDVVWYDLGDGAAVGEVQVFLQAAPSNTTLAIVLAYAQTKQGGWAPTGGAQLVKLGNLIAPAIWGKGTGKQIKVLLPPKLLL